MSRKSETERGERCMQYERHLKRTVWVVRPVGSDWEETTIFTALRLYLARHPLSYRLSLLSWHLYDCVSFPRASWSHLPSASSLIPSGLCQNPGDQEESLKIFLNIP